MVCNLRNSTDSIDWSPDIMTHSSEKISFWNIRFFRFLGNSFQLFLIFELLLFFFRNVTCYIKHLRNSSVCITLLHNESSHMPVPVCSKIFSRNRLFLLQPGCQRCNLKELPHGFLILSGNNTFPCGTKCFWSTSVTACQPMHHLAPDNFFKTVCS